MFNNPSKIMFMSILMVGTMVTVSSNSWLSAWMGLEINLLSFIPLMSDENNLISSEAALKYFLTQALASSALLFAAISMMASKLIFTEMKTFMNWVMISSLLMKSGAAPFHFWFPNVMEGLSWMNSLILMTWQKIAPLMLISYLLISPIMWMSIIMSSFIGAIGGMNQTSLRKLMAFSSINHLGWMMAAMLLSETMWTTYFLIYFILSATIIFMFHICKSYQISQFFSLFSHSKMLKLFSMLNLLSLGGLPPFLGFLPKWIIIQHLTLSGHVFLMITLTTFTLITLYFYLRMCFPSFMMNYYETNWSNSTLIPPASVYIVTILSSLSLFGMLVVNSLFYTL